MSKWNVYKQTLETRFTKVFSYLNPPASKDDILLLEARIGAKLPKEFHSIYNDHDGESSDSPGVAYGMRLLPIQDIMQEMDSWDDIIKDGLDDFNDECTSIPKNAIQCVYADSKWVPLFSDGSGNFIGLDFNPGIKGKIGQIINFGRDEEAKRVVSKTLQSLFTLMTALSTKDYFASEDDGSFSLGNICFIDALTTPNLDQLINQRDPEYGFYSIWAYTEHVDEVAKDYFSNQFYEDFKIDKSVIKSNESSMKQNGNTETIDGLIKFSQYYAKYEKKLLETAKNLNLDKVGIIHIIQNFNYEENKALIQSKERAFYLGSYKVY